MTQISSNSPVLFRMEASKPPTSSFGIHLRASRMIPGANA